MREVKVHMNKPIYLGMIILDIGKILIYEFLYDYLKLKYKENLNLCYMNTDMDTDSSIFNLKTEDWHKDILNDIEQRFDTSNIETNIPIKQNINKKVLGVIKDELNGYPMEKNYWINAKTLCILAR